MAKLDFDKLIEEAMKEVRSKVDEILADALEAIKKDVVKEETPKPYNAKAIVDLIYDLDTKSYELYLGDEFVDSGDLAELIKEYDLGLIVTGD